MSAASSDAAVTHDISAQRFLVGEGPEAAVLQYRRSEGRVDFLHTVVPEAFRGQGIAQKLAHAGLEWAKAERLRVTPTCPFVQSYLRKHPEYQPLVDAP